MREQDRTDADVQLDIERSNEEHNRMRQEEVPSYLMRERDVATREAERLLQAFESHPSRYLAGRAISALQVAARAAVATGCHTQARRHDAARRGVEEWRDAEDARAILNVMTSRFGRYLPWAALVIVSIAALCAAVWR